MPGRDQTGPQGTGPNGRGLGPCREKTGYSGVFGRFARWGRRGGRGRPWGGRSFWQSEDKNDLLAEEKALKQRLASVQEKLNK